MTQNCTQNDLIRLMYNETSPEESRVLREEMESDWESKEAYQELLITAKKLPKVTFAPSQKCISEILHYSKLTALQVEF